jgi:hypothetical protein
MYQKSLFNTSLWFSNRTSVALILDKFTHVCRKVLLPFLFNENLVPVQLAIYQWGIQYFSSLSCLLPASLTWIQWPVVCPVVMWLMEYLQVVIIQCAWTPEMSKYYHLCFCFLNSELFIISHICLIIPEYNLLYLTSGFSANWKSISCFYHFSFFCERTDTDSACFYSRIQYAVSKPTFRSDLLLPPFQSIGCFGFSRYTTFVIYLGTYRLSWCIAKAMYLEKPKQPIIWNRG